MVSIPFSLNLCLSPPLLDHGLLCLQQSLVEWLKLDLEMRFDCIKHIVRLRDLIQHAR